MGKNTQKPNQIKAPERGKGGKFAPQPIKDLPAALKAISILGASK